MSYSNSEAFDPADNELSAIPEFERWTFNPRLFLDSENSELTLGFSAVIEDRLGGDMGYIEGRKYKTVYFEDSSTKRLSSQLEYLHRFQSGTELVLRNSISHFQRDLTVPSFRFSGTQLSSFSEAHLLSTTNSVEWVAGLNLWTQDFEQDNALPGFQHDFHSHTLGAFIQGTLSLAERWTVESGLRIDHSSDYGSFVLPKVSLLYTPAAHTTLRIGGGLGYKEPTLFTEDAEKYQFQGVLPIEPENFEAERSMGLNVDVNRSFNLLEGLSLNVNLLLFYTRVDKPMRLAPTARDKLTYHQLDDYLDTRGTEINSVWERGNFKLLLGYTHTDVQEHSAHGVHAYPLVPKNRLNTVFVYEREDDLRIGLEAYYYGHQELNDGRTSRDYWIVGLMMEKVMSDDLSMFLNFENLTDTRQTRWEPLYTGPLANPIFNDIYAPLDGYVINGGVKLRL